MVGVVVGVGVGVLVGVVMGVFNGGGVEHMARVGSEGLINPWKGSNYNVEVAIVPRPPSLALRSTAPA